MEEFIWGTLQVIINAFWTSLVLENRCSILVSHQSTTNESILQLVCITTAFYPQTDICCSLLAGKWSSNHFSPSGLLPGNPSFFLGFPSCNVIHRHSRTHNEHLSSLLRLDEPLGLSRQVNKLELSFGPPWVMEMFLLSISLYQTTLVWWFSFGSR